MPKLQHIILILIAGAAVWILYDELQEQGPMAEQLISLSEGQRDGPLQVEKIYSDRIDGLNFREYPIAVGNGTPVTLYIGQGVSNGCTITLTLVKTEGDVAVFSKKVDEDRPCPICLSAGAHISTSDGEVQVTELKEGMQVWTADDSGARIQAIILAASKTDVPPGHRMIRLVLDDGRTLDASPGHLLADGRALGRISAGDIVGGAKVLAAERIQYKEKYTYDILPSGDTGTYWANGILMKSTLVATK